MATVTGPAATPNPTGGVETQSVPTRQPELRIDQSEIRNIKIKTAETEAKSVEISGQTYNTLLNTINFNIDIFNQIPPAQRPAILNEFVSAFKAQYLELKDLNDKAKVAECAEKFLREGGGKAVMTAFKLMEWEASLLHGASGARFEGSDPKLASKTPGITEVICIDPTTGALSVQKVNSRSWFDKNFGGFFGTSGDIRGQKQLRIKPVIATGVGSQVVDAGNIAYLDKCGWSNGTNLQTSANRSALFKRLFTIAQARSELFSQTGMNATDISHRLNFVDNSGHLITAGRAAHFIGETGGGYTPAEFAVEGKKITDEIKKDVTEKLKKAKQEKKTGEIGTQLEKKIADLQKGKEMTPEEIKAEQAVIDQEIKKLQSQMELFIRQKLLPGEVTEAQRLTDESDLSLTNRANKLGTSKDDLLKWSAGSEEPESWHSIKNKVDQLKVSKKSITDELADKEKQLDLWLQRQPSVTIDKTTKRLKGGGEIVIEPPEQAVKVWDRWNNTIDSLQEEIQNLEKRLRVDNLPGDTVSLETKIINLETEYLQRKQIVEDDPETKSAIDGFRQAEKNLQMKKDEKTAVDNQIAALKPVVVPPATPETDGDTEKRIKGEIKTQQEKKASIGKSSLDDQREVKALSSVADLYLNPDIKTAMEQRLADQESGIYDDLEYSPEFGDYPKVVLQGVKLMFGPEALISVGNTDLYQRTKALLESQWYVKIMIEQIEAQNAVLPANKVAFTETRVPGSPNVKIESSALKGLTNLKAIETLTVKDINQKTVEQILEAIRKSALGIV